MSSQIQRSYQECTEGIRLARLGLSGEALSAFATALSLNPSSVAARICLALYFRAQGRYEGAIEQATIAIELTHSNRFMSSRSHRCRALVHRDRGDFASALDDLTKAIALDGGFVDALYQRGLVHLASHRFVSALTDFTSALEQDPTMKDAIIARDHAVQRLIQSQRCAPVRSWKPASRNQPQR